MPASPARRRLVSQEFGREISRSAYHSNCCSSPQPISVTASSHERAFGVRFWGVGRWGWLLGQRNTLRSSAAYRGGLACCHSETMPRDGRTSPIPFRPVRYYRRRGIRRQCGETLHKPRPSGRGGRPRSPCTWSRYPAPHRRGMQLHRIPVPDGRHDRARSQDAQGHRQRTPSCRPVAGRRPREKPTAVDKIRTTLIVRDHRPVRKPRPTLGVRAPPPLVIDPLNVERVVQVVRRERAGGGRSAARSRPVPAKLEIPASPALRARAVARGQGRGLVEEEELGVAPGRHDPAPAPLEPQHADDPALADPGAPDVSIGVVQAAAVAHQRAAGRCRDQLAERRDAILSRHERAVIRPGWPPGGARPRAPPCTPSPPP